MSDASPSQSVHTDIPELPTSDALQQLVREHEALLAFMYAAPVGVVQIKMTGEVEMINGFSALMLMPITQNRALDNLFELLSVVLPELQQHIENYRHGHGLVCDNLRLQIPAGSGQNKVASFRVIKMDFERVIVVITDVTDQVKAEIATLQAQEAQLKMQHLDAENQRLLEVSRLKAQFVGNLSHELRTPLTSILGYADLLSSERLVPDSERVREGFGLIGRQGRLLLQLINDLLDMSAMQSDRFEIHPSLGDASAWVQDVMVVLQGNALERGVHLQAELNGAPGEVWLDERCFKQIAYNLLSNAIKFTPKDGHITIELSADPTHVQLAVRDTGIGIAPDKLQDVFIDFHQLDGSSTRSYEGTGLGLALTRKLVQAQDGEVGVSSVLGKGSTFWVRLPLRTQPAFL